MKLLLDTHVALWLFTDDERLPEDIKKIIMSDDNDIYYSIVSVWEIALKHSTHPDKMRITAEQFNDYAERSGYKLLNLKPGAVYMFPKVVRPDDAPQHKDPFDRMLIAQTQYEYGMKFVTHDKLLPYYDDKNIIFF